MRTIARLGLFWLIVALLPAVVHALDFSYTTSNGTITITGYTGSGGAVTMPDAIDSLPVTGIGNSAFEYCTSLTGVTIPAGITRIGERAFSRCTGLTGAYFKGSAPTLRGSYVFYDDNKATVYYLPGTTGWGTTYGGLPAVLWNPQVQGDGFGVQSGQFGFTFTNAGSPIVVLEACTDLVNPAWTPVGTNALVGGSSRFDDPDWSDHPVRFYRLRMPW